MQKITYIFCFIIISSGCSVRRMGLEGDSVSEKLSKEGIILETIRKHNITGTSFYIQKAEFETLGGKGHFKGMGSVKFEKPDKYLISVKSRSGIEVARMFITSDTILINDRINKKLYYGSPSYIKSKIGISTSFLPLILGDYINDIEYGEMRIGCMDGKLNVEGTVEKESIKYVIDCRQGKSILAIPVSGNLEKEYQIKYSNFLKRDDILIPEQIEISEKQDKATIKIVIQKIEVPWNGTIEFIPGNRYENIQLL